MSVISSRSTRFKNLLFHYRDVVRVVVGLSGLLLVSAPLTSHLSFLYNERVGVTVLGRSLIIPGAILFVGACVSYFLDRR